MSKEKDIEKIKGESAILVALNIIKIRKEQTRLNRLLVRNILIIILGLVSVMLTCLYLVAVVK